MEGQGGGWESSVILGRIRGESVTLSLLNGRNHAPITDGLHRGGYGKFQGFARGSAWGRRNSTATETETETETKTETEKCLWHNITQASPLRLRWIPDYYELIIILRGIEDLVSEFLLYFSPSYSLLCSVLVRLIQPPPRPIASTSFLDWAR